MATVRERMIEGALRLLAKRGLQATSFSEVVELTGTPRGSIYHHFPQGKDEMVAAALAVAGEHALGVLRDKAGEPAVEITRTFLGLWRSLLVHTDFEAGCAVLAVTTATDSPDLLAQAGAIFRGWRKTLADLLAQGGMAAPEAFAATLVSACEGAVVLSRAERDITPFDLMAEDLLSRF